MQRDNIQARLEQRMCLRHEQIAIDSFGDFVLIIRGCQTEDVCAACFDFFHIGHRFFKQLRHAGDGDDEGVILNQQDRTVLQFACGIRFGVNIGDLLELEAAL